MNREEQIDFNQEIQEYLQNNNVHQIFNKLVQSIAIEKPKDLLDFIVQELQKPQKITLFVVGPPGLSINSIIAKAIAQDSRQFEIFNFGQEVSAIQGNLSEDDKKNARSCKLVKNESVCQIIDKIEKCAKSDKNCIIEGFPKNLNQALILQKKGIYAKNVLIVNVHNDGLTNLCTSKIESLNPDIDFFQKNDLVREAVLEHELNLREVKGFYKNYKQIDISRSKEEEYIIKELKKAFSIQTTQTLPRATTQIIVVGAPYSGRTTLGKKIAQHYNLIYISTSILIAEEVRRDTIHGRKIKNAFMNNQLIDNFLMEKLIEERISKKDCRMQGFVLEGYPKNKEQFDNIKNMKLNPSLTVAIDTPIEVSEKRCNLDPKKFSKRYQNWKDIEQPLKESKERIFWVDPLLDLNNMYQQTIHELEKSFI